jgi:L-glyceraldehyde 3-phosphate reductase
LIKSGKALYVGLSNYDGEGLTKAAKILDELQVPFIVNQNRYSILDRTIEENGLIDAAKKTKKGVIAFSPLAQGLLAGRYSDGIPDDSRVRTNGFSLKESAITEEKLSAVRGLAAIASARGETLPQTALAWVLNREPVCGVIIGASSHTQILENVKAANYAPFSNEELRAIDELTKNANL